MKKQLLFALVLIAALLLATGSATAKATRTDFTGTLYNCEGTAEPERIWETGNGPIMHIRGATGECYFVSDDLPLFNGRCTGVVDLDLNLSTGSGRDRATFIKYPYGKNGTLEGVAITHYTNFVGSMRGVGHGTGELAGMMYFGDYVQVVPLPEDPPPASVGCEVAEVYTMTGVLLDIRGD